jgi:hypothetical protein
MSLELAIFRRSLERLRGASSFHELASSLGFEAETQPTDFLDDRASALHRRIADISDGLFRVGSLPVQGGTMGFWAASLRKWGERSADRERARRRITRALGELAPANDIRFLLTITAEGQQDLELVLPRPRQDKSFGTIRAVIDRKEPTNHHLQLLADLVLETGLSSAAALRRWSEAFNV